MQPILAAACPLASLMQLDVTPRMHAQSPVPASMCMQNPLSAQLTHLHVATVLLVSSSEVHNLKNESAWSKTHGASLSIENGHSPAHWVCWCWYDHPWKVEMGRPVISQAMQKEEKVTKNGEKVSASNFLPFSFSAGKRGEF